MTTEQKITGDLAEQDALKFLIQKGLRLLEKNYACYFGEIDLIMQDTEQIVFVEVRYRTRSEYSSAADSITSGKIKKLIRAATHYLQFRKCLHKVSARFDVIAIDAAGEERKINWIRNAFQT